MDWNMKEFFKSYEPHLFFSVNTNKHVVPRSTVSEGNQLDIMLLFEHRDLGPEYIKVQLRDFFIYYNGENEGISPPVSVLQETKSQRLRRLNPHTHQVDRGKVVSRGEGRGCTSYSDVETYTTSTWSVRKMHNPPCHEPQEFEKENRHFSHPVIQRLLPNSTQTRVTAHNGSTQDKGVERCV